MTRIAHVLHGWPPEEMGGTGLYVAATARAQRALGHHVRCAYPAADEAADDPHAKPFVGQPPRFWSDTWRHRQRLARWRAWQREWSPEVVHIHHLSGWPLALPQVAREGGATVVMTLHDYALPCARGQLLNRSGAPCAGPTPTRCARCVGPVRALSPATVAMERAAQRWPRLAAAGRRTISESAPSPATQTSARDRTLAAQAALAAPHRLLSPSRDLARRFTAMGLRTPEHCPLPLVQPIPAAPPSPPGPLRFLFASSLIYAKGPDVLLAAFRTLPAGAAELSIAGHAPTHGDGVQYATAIAADTRRTPNATLLGPLPPKDMPKTLAQHDVLVLPSRWPENSPLIIREATAAGLRTVVSSIGGAAELDPLARLTPPGDIGALGDALMAEITTGPRRHLARRWQSADRHARWLDRWAYTA